MNDFDFGAVHQQVQAQFGQKGHKWWANADGTTNADDIYFAIQAVEESQIDYTDNKTNTSFTNKTIPAGFIIYGELKSIAVDSGSVILYIGDFKQKV